MKKILLMFFIGMLLLLIIQSNAIAVDCDKCQDMYDALYVMGYSKSEIKEGVLMYDGDCADCFGWSSSGSGDSGSSSDNMHLLSLTSTYFLK